MKKFALGAILALVLSLITSPQTALAQGRTVSLTLDGRVYRATAYPVPLPKGEESYAGYFDRLWQASEDLGRCLNALSPNLGDGLAALIAPMETPPQDAYLTVTDTGVEITPDVEGSGFDRYRLGSAVAACLDGKPPQDVFRAPLVAAITRQDLTERTQTIGQFQTRYDPANRNRERNLRLACQALNGRTIEAGERVSFNALVGERTAERGFLPAPVVRDGEYVQGIGGGVCQVSTTLYNAALRAGLEVIRSYPHTLTAHYVQAGWDAMVSDWSDLVFVNDSPYPLYIFASAADGKLRVKILGAARGKVRLWAGDPTVDKAPDLTEDGAVLSDVSGYVLVKRGQDGIKITTYRSIDGVKQKVRFSSYPTLPNVWRKAPDASPDQTESPLP